MEAAIDARRAGADFPDDIGKVVADAYRDALEGESERIALGTAVTYLKNHLDYLRTTEAETALEALGAQLRDFRAEVPNLGGARTAEGVIEVGGKAPQAWKTPSAMLGKLRAIRQAQHDTLRPLGDGQRLRQLKDAGHFEVAGLSPGDVPADIVTAMTSGHYTVDYLVYLANIGTAWVPGSFEELEGEESVPDVGIPDGPLRDYTPTETPVPKPPAPERTGAERSPELQY
ncbi:hypothetical protein ABZS61_25870 [Streptomyces sp. NPDC005566]|uniref:hypothetical protein n=1 Tax=Streptomyces sp. NPDC005566 TaxID=3156886 RepID=UPI0033B3B8C5